MLARALALVVTVGLALATASGARAQQAEADGKLADAWTEDVLEEQDSQDTLLRYLGAPSTALLGGLFLTEPAWSDLSPPAADVAFVVAGALMATAAVGTWATPDPYDATRWYGSFGSLGFVALGTALIAGCGNGKGGCNHRVTRHLGVTYGAIDAGLFMSFFLLWALLPPPSPQAYGLSVHGGSPEQRHARVLGFLKERYRRRRIGAYVALPFGVAMGVSLLVLAHEAETSDGRAFMYGAGGVLLAVVAGTTLYELLRTPDFERLEAGERPDD